VPPIEKRHEPDFEVYPNLKTIQIQVGNGLERQKVKIPHYWIIDHNSEFSPYFNSVLGDVASHIIPFSLKSLCARHLGLNLTSEIWNNIVAHTPFELREYVLRHTPFDKQLNIVGNAVIYNVCNNSSLFNGNNWYPSGSCLDTKFTCTGSLGKDGILEKYKILVLQDENIMEVVLKKRTEYKDGKKHGEQVIYDNCGNIEGRDFFEKGNYCGNGLRYRFGSGNTIIYSFTEYFNDLEYSKILIETIIKKNGTFCMRNNHNNNYAMFGNLGGVRIVTEMFGEENVGNKFVLDENSNLEYCENPCYGQIIMVTFSFTVPKKGYIAGYAFEYRGNSKSEFYTLIKTYNDKQYVMKGVLVCTRNYLQFCDPNVVNARTYQELNMPALGIEIDSEYFKLVQ
jgi:hypothetical protein